jgi:hypothetical protein
MIMSIFRIPHKITETTYGWLPKRKRHIIHKSLATYFNIFHTSQFSLPDRGKIMAKPRQNRPILDSSYTILRTIRDCSGHADCLPHSSRRPGLDPGPLPRATHEAPDQVRGGVFLALRDAL